MKPTHSVLIVEDEWLVAADLAETLTELGYEVLGTVDTGEQAIAEARTLVPDAVLMDVMLRGELDGIAAARVIHEDLGCPVVFLTAYTDANTFERALGTEPASYITKPFQARQVDNALRLAIYRDQAQRLRERSRQLVEQSLTALSEGLVIIDPRLRVLKANPAARKLLATPLERHVPLSLCLEALDPGDAATLLDELRRCIDERRDHHGTLETMPWHITPLFDRRGAVAGAALTLVGPPPATPPTQAHAPCEPVRICSWSRTVFDETRNAWVPFEEYFSRHHGVRFSYGISPQALVDLELDDL